MAAATFVIAVFAALVFVPLKYIYPSKLTVLRRTTIGLAAAWLLLLTYAVLNPERAEQRLLVQLSLLYPAYYFALSFRLGGVHRSRG